MMVINMLQNIYEQFDIYCGQLDVYKVIEDIDVIFFLRLNWKKFILKAAGWNVEILE